MVSKLIEKAAQKSVLCSLFINELLINYQLNNSGMIKSATTAAIIP